MHLDGNGVLWAIAKCRICGEVHKHVMDAVAAGALSTAKRAVIQWLSKVRCLTAVTQSGKSLRGPLRSPPRASPTMRLRLALPQTHCPASQSIATRRGSSSDGATGVEHLYKLPDAGEPSKDENADTAVGRVAGDATTRRWISAEAGAERSRHVKC